MILSFWVIVFLRSSNTPQAGSLPLAYAMNKLTWNEFYWTVLLLAGVAGAIHGLTAREFTFRRRGWLPGQEKERLQPQWYHRLFVVSVAVVLAVYAYSSLHGVHWRH